MSDTSQGPGWWMASDGKWYAPELHPDANQTPPAQIVEAADSEVGEGQFGDGIASPLYEFTASKFKTGRWFSPNVIRVWSDRVEEYEHHAVRKKGTQAINFHQVAQVKVGRGLRWTDISVESTGGHTIVMKGVPKNDAEKVKGIIDSAVHSARTGALQPAVSRPGAAVPQVSVADEIAKLVALRDAGALTDEEFAAHKASLLPGPAA